MAIKRTDPDFGKGKVDLSIEDMREAYSISSDAGKGGKDFMNSPLFKGLTAQTRREFSEAMLRHRRSVAKNEVMTIHGRTMTGEVVRASNSPLWVRDRELIKANLYDLPDNAGDLSKKQIGDTAEFEVMGLRAWFANSVPSPVLIEPGLQARSAVEQRATRIPSLAEMDVPHPDLARLMENTTGIFSELLKSDNEADITSEEGYKPHALPAMSTEEADLLFRKQDIRTQTLDMAQPFAPTRNLKGPHAVVLQGEGIFVSRSTASSHRGRTALEMTDVGVVPLAVVQGAPSLAFQWVGLNTREREASAVFIPSAAGTTASYIPLTPDDLTARLVVMNSMAETAASMHRHLGSLEANQGMLKKLQKKLAGLRGLFGS